MPDVHHSFTHMAPRKALVKDKRAFTRQIVSLLFASLIAYALFSSTTSDSGTASTCNDMSAALALLQSSSSWNAIQRSRPAPGSTRNVVLAAITNSKVPSARLPVFVQSWAEFSPGTQLVLFTETDILERTSVKQLYAEFGVIGIPFAPLPELDDPEDPEDFTKPGRLPMHSMQEFVKYLLANGDKIKGVGVVMDAAGVALQGDPFIEPAVTSAIQLNQILLTTEGGPTLGNVTVGQHNTTLRALNSCFGSGVTNTLTNKQLFNADVYFGAPDATRRFLALIADVMQTRVRARCLRDFRADRPALQYAIQDFGGDLKSLDFKYQTKNHIVSPVFGAAFGMPAKLDGRGVLHRGALPGKYGRRGRTPSLISEYHAHPLLVRHYQSRYHFTVGDIDFAQNSAYAGDALPGGGELPVSWERAVKDSYNEILANLGQQTPTVDQIIDAMLVIQKEVLVAAKKESEAGREVGRMTFVDGREAGEETEVSLEELARIGAGDGGMDIDKTLQKLRRSTKG